MKKFLLLLLLSTLLISCGSSKNTTKTIIVNKKGVPNRTRTVERKKSKDNIIITTTEADEVITKDSNKEKLEKIIDIAKSFEGTRYKYGGTTTSGMDCSGLIYTSFKEENVLLPRVSRDMATKGIEITLPEATKGDLLFFHTSKKKNVITHVGLVLENKKGEVIFIHSTTSRGVIISSMEENYWKNSFLEIRRII